MMQLFDGRGNLLLTEFVLNSNFSNLKVFAADQNQESNPKIGIGGIETAGPQRGPGYQIFESNGTLSQIQFLFDSEF